MSSTFLDTPFIVDNPNVIYSDEYITSEYILHKTLVDRDKVHLVNESMTFRTKRYVPKTGIFRVCNLANYYFIF